MSSNPERASHSDSASVKDMIPAKPSFARTRSSRCRQRTDLLATRTGLPPARRDVLTGELKKNDPRFLRRQVHLYLEYLDHHGSLARRFCDSGIPAWVVFGESDDIGITADEREMLETTPHVRLVEIADAGHFTLNQKPSEIARLVLDAVASRAA